MDLIFIVLDVFCNPEGFRETETASVCASMEQAKLEAYQFQAELDEPVATSAHRYFRIEEWSIDGGCESIIEMRATEPGRWDVWK